jgi:hypothetical protein
MIFRLLLCFVAIRLLGQTVPGTYPYPVPLPTTGATPVATIKVTGPVNTPGYGDSRPAIWDSFVGGGYRSVNTTAERDAILSGRRKQGMVTWVAADNHLYQLDSDLTSWIDLGATVSNVLTPIYRGQATGGPGTFVADNATIDPDYTPTTVPPEYTVAAIKFDSNSQGSDTLRLGNATADTPIKRPDGSVIQADDIVVGKVVLLTRSGTASGSAWTLQAVASATAPSPATDITTIATATGDLYTSNQDMVVTRGYLFEGDGGHGVYRKDSSSVATINNITVWDCSTGGRYLLMNSGSISSKQAGAAADGISDDHNALQGLFDLCPNMAARIDPGSYRVVGGLTLSDHTKVVARGATITVETTGEDRAIDMASWCEWVGGTVIDAYQSGGSSGNDHCPFRFGDWKGVSNQGVSNSILKQVTIDVSGDFDSSSVFITQDSHNIDISEIEIPSSSVLGGGIVIHWGWVTYPTEASGTRHPHNIRCKNVQIGSLTTTTHQGFGVASAGAYDVSYENIDIARCRYAIEATNGDFGFRYSGLTQLMMGAVSFKNITCRYIYDYGALVSSQNTFDTNRYTLNHVIENCVLVGANAGAGQAGIWLTSARNLTIRNTVFAGHEVGTYFTNGCANILFDNCSFATNRLGGFVAADPNTTAITVSKCRFQNNSWGLSGSAAAGIKLLAGSNFRITDNDIGNPGAAEANQEVGLQLIPSFVNATVTGNNVLRVKSGGVDIGYYLGSASDTGHLWVVHDNQANAATLISGPANIPYIAKGKYRVFTGSATPTVGTYIVGDEVVFDTATSTPFAKRCSVAGSSGTWVTAY